MPASTINENVAANSTIGTLTTTDPDAANTFTYSLVAGTGDGDNASFNISGSDLQITNSPDFETQSSYSVRIRTTDQGSLSYEETFAITISNANETPTDLVLSASSIDENVAANSTIGTLTTTIRMQPIHLLIPLLQEPEMETMPLSTSAAAIFRSRTAPILKTRAVIV